MPDRVPYCQYYRAGCKPENLPCYKPDENCKFCTQAHQQWSRFKDDVDDVIPLAVHQICRLKKEDNHEQDHRSALVTLLVGDITESVQITDEGLELAVCEVAEDDDNPAVKITHTYSSYIFTSFVSCCKILLDQQTTPRSER